MSETNLYNVGYDVGFEDGFNEAQGRIEQLEIENKNLRHMIIDQIEGAGDDPEIMAASRAEWAARAKAAEDKLAQQDELARAAVVEALRSASPLEN